MSCKIRFLACLIVETTRFSIKADYSRAGSVDEFETNVLEPTRHVLAMCQIDIDFALPQMVVDSSRFRRIYVSRRFFKCAAIVRDETDRTVQGIDFRSIPNKHISVAAG